MVETHRTQSAIRQEFDLWKVDAPARHPKLKPLIEASKSAALEAVVATGLLFAIFLVVFLWRRLRPMRSVEARPLGDLVQSAWAQTQKDSAIRPAEVSPETPLPREGRRAQEAEGSEAEPFLRHMEEHVRARLKELDETKRIGQAQERTVFAILMLAGLLTLGLLLGGVVLVAAERMTAAVLAECAAILPGSGTLILRKRSRVLAKQRESIAGELNSHVRELQAIQLVLSVPDRDKRGEAMVDLARKLLEEAKRTP
jgi:hypothetical protein